MKRITDGTEVKVGDLVEISYRVEAWDEKGTMDVRTTEKVKLLKILPDGDWVVEYPKGGMTHLRKEQQYSEGNL